MVKVTSKIWHIYDFVAVVNYHPFITCVISLYILRRGMLLCLCCPRGLMPSLSPSCDHATYQHARTHNKLHVFSFFSFFFTSLCVYVLCVQCQRERGRDTEGERESVSVQNGYHARIQAERAEGAGAQFQPLPSLKNSSSCVIKTQRCLSVSMGV